MLTFLHLSDLHFTVTDADSAFDRDAKIRETLLADLGKDGRTKFDAILVTGDIAYHGMATEFARAKDWFEVVRKATESSPEALYVIPGNHDVNRKAVEKDSSLWELHQSLRNKKMSYEDRLASLNKKLRDNSFDFLTALNEYRAFSLECDCPTTPKDLAWVQSLNDGQLLEDGTVVRFHGLNSALLSDGDDEKANLLLGATQFHHFNSDPGYVNVVLCHHPHSWMSDGNESNDFFRNQAHLVLCGHEHDPRIYREGRSLRVFAGAVHPNPREPKWLPCYHVIRLSIKAEMQRDLVINVETRVWMDKEKCFGPYAMPNGSLRQEEIIGLPAWNRSAPKTDTTLHSPSSKSLVESQKEMTNESTLSNDAFAAARRKLIVHFFRLGTLSRYQVAIDAGVFDDSDDAYDGQARWARVFERAEKTGKFAALWEAVAAKDDTLTGKSNPFTTQE
jgi:predicted MPP superfamily phosphohydrolase